MNFEIIDPRPVNKNTLRGFFTLRAGPLEIEGYSFHEKNGKTWVNPPAREYTDESGEKKYASMIKIPDKDRYWKFQAWARSQLAEIFKPQTVEQEHATDDIPF